MNYTENFETQDEYFGRSAPSKKFAATISVCVQVGVDRWQQHYHTKVFNSGDSMNDVLKWAEQYVKNPTVNDITFGNVD